MSVNSNNSADLIPIMLRRMLRQPPLERLELGELQQHARLFRGCQLFSIHQRLVELLERLLQAHAQLPNLNSAWVGATHELQ